LLNTTVIPIQEKQNDLPDSIIYRNSWHRKYKYLSEAQHTSLIELNKA